MTYSGYVPSTGSTLDDHRKDGPSSIGASGDWRDRSQGDAPVVPGDDGAFGDYRGYVPFSSGSQRVVYEHDYSYWERPENIAAHYDAIKANPDTDWAGLGVDVDFVNQAYDYFKAANLGKSYWDWKPLGEDDPFTNILRNSPEPVDDAQWQGIYKPDYLKDNPNWWDQAQPQAQVPAGADLANLTGWQRTMAFVMGSGALQGAMNVLPIAAIGTLAALALPGAAIGAGAAVLGGVGAVAAGAALGIVGDPENQEAGRKKLLGMGLEQGTVDFILNAVNAPLKALSLPGELAEQVIGTAYQYGQAALPGLGYLAGDQSMYDEYLQSQKDVKAIVDNLPAVWDASRLTYEAMSATAPGVALSSIPAGIEFVLDMTTQGETDVELAQVGEVYRLDGDPIKLDVVGAAALSAARNEIVSGKDPQQVAEKYQQMFGFSGQWTDLWAQTVLDPLNLLPKAGRGVADTVAKVTGDPVLARAVGDAKAVKGGIVDVGRAYTTRLRQAEIPVENMSWLQRTFAGLADDGTYKELNINTGGARKERGVLSTLNKVNPVNFWKGINELTPKSKALASNKLLEVNLHDIVGSAASMNDALTSVKALQDMKPGVAVAGARLVQNAEMYTVQRSVVTAKQEVKAVESRWRMTENSRNFFNRVSALVGEDTYKIVDELNNGGPAEAQALHSRLVAKLSEADPNHPILRDPSFTPDTLVRHAEQFKNNKWALNEEYAKAHLTNQIMSKATEFHIQAFGVQPDNVFFRAGQALKAVQSLLLLSFSPSYLINNVINNDVTMRATGVGGFLGMSDKRFQRLAGEIGAGKSSDGVGMVGERVRPTKSQYDSLDEAFMLGGRDAAAEYTRQQAQGQIAGAMRVEGPLQKARELVQKVPQPMTTLSGKAEGAQTDIAIRNGFTKSWGRNWTEKELSKVLIDNGADTALARLLKMCETEADIDRVFGGAMDFSASAFAESVARSMGHDPAMLNTMFDQLGIKEKFDFYTGSGLDPYAASEAILQDLNVIRKENLAERRKVAAQQGAVVMRGEGFAAGVDTLHDMMWSQDEFWTRSFQANEAAFREANQMEPSDRRRFLDQHFKTQNEAWRTEFALREATWEGFLREAGFTDPAAIDQLSLPAKQFMGETIDNHNRWAQFYVERERRVKKFFEESTDADPSYSAQLWAEAQADISTMYDNFSALELESVKRQGAAFMEMWREQMGIKGIEGVAYWWKGVYETAQRRQSLMKDMRAWERGQEPQLPEVREVLAAYAPKDRHQAWQPFLEKVYLPAIGEMTNANLLGTKALSDAATGRPLAPEMREALDWFNENFIVNPEDQAIAAAKAAEVKLGRDVDAWLQELEQSSVKSEQAVLEAETSRRERLLETVNATREQAGLDPYVSFDDIPADEVVVAMNEQAVVGVDTVQPQGLSTQRYLEPMVIADIPVMGAAYVDGKFVAYIPARFEGKSFNTDSGPARILGIDPEGKWVYQLESGEIKKLADGSQDAPVVGPYIPGTMASNGATQPDLATLFAEGFDTFVTPAIYEMARQMKYEKPIVPDMATAGVTPQVIDQLKSKMRADKRAALRFAETQRNFALLNYDKRTGFDSALDLIFPYQFWFTRSMTNWTLRFADRPGMLATFARISQFTDEEMDDRFGVIPNRLKQKIRIPAPWLNSIAPWAGGAVYIDPWGKLFPAREFARPVENYLYGRSRIQRKAEKLLMDWSDDGDIDADEAAEALDNMTGPLWEKAMAAAEQEEGADVVDFMSLLSSPSLAVSMVVRGPERTGPFPMSRMIQGLAAATGIEGLTRLDLEAQWRQSAGLSEFGEYGDYLIDRQLSNLAADGEFTPEETIIAMIEKEGPAYEAALDRVRMEMALRQPGLAPILATRNALKGDGNLLDILGAAVVGMIPGGLLPEGELKQRGLYDEYQQMWKDYHAGDKNADDRFFDAHPEYKARLALYDEPEERLKQFVISTVWDRYSNLPDPLQKAVEQELGGRFTELFLTKETQDYDALNTEELVEWSQALGSGYTPEGMGYTAPMEFEGEDAAVLYQQQKDAMFPNIGEIQSLYYDATTNEQKNAVLQRYPELARYWAFRDTFLADNPELIPYMVSEDSSLAGADPGVQQMVYRYRAERARLYGADILTIQSEYFQLPEKSPQRRAFLQAHPELKSYWDWNRGFKEDFPEIVPYLPSDKAKAMLGTDYTKKYGTPANVSNFDPDAQAALMGYFTRNVPLGDGAKQYLRLQWDKAGRPGSFNEWLSSLGVYYGK